MGGGCGGGVGVAERGGTGRAAGGFGSRVTDHDVLDGRREDGEASRAVPRHVACVMDGNGRWAEQRSLPRTEGHRAAETKTGCTPA